MKFLRTILTAILPGAIFLLAGCDGIREPENGSGIGDGTISFTAGVSPTLEATRATEDWPFISRTAFNAGESFRVFGRRSGEGSHIRIFGDDGVIVSSSDPDSNPATPLVWSYSPPSYWYWLNVSNYYDFIAAFYPDPVPDPTGLTDEQIAAIRAAKDAHRMESSPGVDIPGEMAIEMPYSLSDNYDLLMAGTRRYGTDTDHRSNKIPLLFQHMMCAVRVCVKNESSSTLVRLDSIRFDNLIQSAHAKATIDVLGEPEFSWINTQRTSALRTVFQTGQDLAANGGAYTPADYKLFIPADLSVAIDGSLEPRKSDYTGNMAQYALDLAGYERKIPHLIISYTVGAVHKRFPIALKNIPNARYGSEECIDTWGLGLKYTYNITIRLDGGVVVSVVTTQWEDIEAETPGLLI